LRTTTAARCTGVVDDEGVLLEKVFRPPSIRVQEPTERYGKRRMLRLLIIGDAGSGSGYARVAEEVIPHLAKHLELLHLPLGVVGPYAHSFCPLAEGVSIHGSDWPLELARRVTDYGPTHVLIIGDMWRAARILPPLSQQCPHVRLLAWGPLDARTVDPRMTSSLAKAHHLILYTSEQSASLARHLPEASAATCATVGLGVDTSSFRRHESRSTCDTIDDRTEAQRSIFGANVCSSTFIVLNANSNLIRKRIDITVAAFARFAADKPENVKLCLHMRAGGISAWDLGALCTKYGVSNRLVSPAVESHFGLLRRRELAMLYNACDVGLNTSVGEGWGMVAVEHGATEAAQIVPNHTSCAELWKDSALLARSDRATSTDVVGYEEFAVSAVDVAEKLNLLYHDAPLRRTYAKRAAALALRTTYSWETVAGQLIALLSPAS
jgi:D-inositol-3-phosphate glycosyltransferase